VKNFYNLILPPEFKAEIVNDASLRTSLLWIPGSYASERQYHLITDGVKYLRVINGLLLCSFLFFIWYKSKDFYLFLALLSLLVIGNFLFTALLDSWLFIGAVGGYWLLSVGNPVGWVFSLLLAPLCKFYGALTTPFALFKYPKTPKQFAGALAALVFVVVVVWGVQSIAYGASHYFLQLSGPNSLSYTPETWPGPTALDLRYALPFIGIALVKYRKG
jgi:hypothetical protein